MARTKKIYFKGEEVDIGADAANVNIDNNSLSGKAFGSLTVQDLAEVVDTITVDVVSNVAQDSILGRTTAGSGDSEELTAAQVRTLINVEDGATADQTGAEIKTAYEAEGDTNALLMLKKQNLLGWRLLQRQTQTQ